MYYTCLQKNGLRSINQTLPLRCQRSGPAVCGFKCSNIRKKSIHMGGEQFQGDAGTAWRNSGAYAKKSAYQTCPGIFLTKPDIGAFKN